MKTVLISLSAMLLLMFFVSSVVFSVEKVKCNAKSETYEKLIRDQEQYIQNLYENNLQLRIMRHDNSAFLTYIDQMAEEKNWGKLRVASGQKGR